MTSGAGNSVPRFMPKCSGPPKQLRTWRRRLRKASIMYRHKGPLQIRVDPAEDELKKLLAAMEAELK